MATFSVTGSSQSIATASADSAPINSSRGISGNVSQVIGDGRKILSSIAFDPIKTGSGFTLSNNDLTVINNGLAASAATVGTAGYPADATQDRSWTITIQAVNNGRMGLGQNTVNLETNLPRYKTSESWVLFYTGVLYDANYIQIAQFAEGAWAIGDVIECRLRNGRVYWRINNGQWNGSLNHNPLLDNGLSVSDWGSAIIYPVFSGHQEQITADFSGWENFSIPTGAGNAAAVSSAVGHSASLSSGSSHAQSAVIGRSQDIVPPTIQTIGNFLLLYDANIPAEGQSAGLAQSVSAAQGRSNMIIPGVAASAATSTASGKYLSVSSGAGSSVASTVSCFARSEFVSVAVGEDFLPAGLKLEFRRQQFTLFTALKIEFPDHTTRLLDSAGYVTINGEAYKGRDPIDGILYSIDSISDGSGDDAPAIRIILSPPDDASSLTVLSPNTQGSRVTVMMGAIDTITGILVGAQEIFYGELDQPSLQVDGNMTQLVLECVSAFERFFDDDEGTRLTDAWLQSVWPGDKGLQYVTDIERQIPWGADAPLPAVVSSGSGGQTTVAGTYFDPYSYVNKVLPF